MPSTVAVITQMTDNSASGKQLKPWEKAWTNSKFVFKNPRCLKSKIPLAPTCAYDEAMKPEDKDQDESPDVTADKLDDVSMPKPKVKQPKTKAHKTRESLKEWKQRRRRFVEKEPRREGMFATRIGFPYSDLPMEPKREEERVLPNFPPGMSRAERRHWEAWSHS